MTRSHSGRALAAALVALGLASAVSACSDPPPPTTTTVEQTTTRTVTPAQPPVTITRTHVQQSP